MKGVRILDGGTRLGLAALAVLTLLLVSAHSGAHGQQAHAPSTGSAPADVLREVIDAINAGDLDRLPDFFANDATIEGAPDCQQPCTGAEAIRNEFEYIVAAGVHVTLGDISVAGDTAAALFEATSTYLRGVGIDRVVGRFTANVVDGKITSASFVLDANDRATARALDLLRALPQRNQPQPPSAGAGPGPSSLEVSWLAFVLAAGGGMATSCALVVIRWASVHDRTA